MKQAKILIVDDDKELRDLMRDAFELNGYTDILTAGSGPEALEIINTSHPHLLLLDVMMPGMDGFEVLKEIRQQTKLPVIMLTAKGEAEDKYMGFEYGADDYIVKPFLTKELLFRVKAVLRRSYPELDHLVRLHHSTVDLGTAEVTNETETYKLTAKEMAIFRKLYENAGMIVSTASLCQTAIGDIWTGYENTLVSHIRHLRQKIERNPSKPESLVTIRGLGYRLILPERERK